MPINIRHLTQFKFFKLALGCYLAVTYFFLIGERGILIPPYNTQYPMIPSFFPISWILGSGYADMGVTLFLLLGSASAFGLALLQNHRPWTLLNWFFWVQVMAIHPIYFLPQDGFIGWFLLAIFLVPTDALAKTPRQLWLLAWFITGLSYFASAATKLQSSSWMDGETMGLLFNSALARSHALMPLLNELPELPKKLFTWGALGMEFLLLPLSLFEAGRKMAWILLLSFHLFVLFTVDITSVTLAFFVFQIFLWNPDWRRSRA